MRSSRFSVGPKSDGRCLQRKAEGIGDTDPQSRRPCKDMEKGSGGTRPPQAKESLGPAEAGRGKEGWSPGAFGGILDSCPPEP